MSELPDTPAWSPGRKRAVWTGILAGIGYTLLGALRMEGDGLVRQLMIEGGMTMTVGSIGIYAGVAGFERFSAFWGARRTAKLADAGQGSPYYQMADYYGPPNPYGYGYQPATYTRPEP